MLRRPGQYASVPGGPASPADTLLAECPVITLDAAKRERAAARARQREADRVRRYGLAEPGYILRIPRECAGDAELQHEVAMNLHALADALSRGRAAGLPFDAKTLQNLVHRYSRRMRGKPAPPPVLALVPPLSAD